MRKVKITTEEIARLNENQTGQNRILLKGKEFREKEMLDYYKTEISDDIEK